jgi:tRNA(Ile)-lysidine synthase
MLVAEVQACIDAYAMLSPGARVIVAVSGGPDSMALLSVLHALRLKFSLSLIVAHVDHQLRGEEARHDARFVAQQAARFGLPFYQTQVDVKAYQRTSGLSPQHAARALRYAFFHSLRRAVGASHVALGHTADDQAETVLMRLIRGSGPAGLAGIPAIRPPFIRPLIRTSRWAIMNYLRAEGIPWIIDSSNTHRTYLRNRIRLELLPTLRQFNPQVLKRLTDLADMLQADNIVLERQVDAIVGQCVTWRPGKRAIIQCEAYWVAPLALQRRVVRRLIEALLTSADTTGFEHVEALRKFINTGRVGKRLALPGQIMAERHGHTVLLWNTQKTPVLRGTLTLDVPGEVSIDALGMQLFADLIDAVAYLDKTGSQWAYLDLKQVQSPLSVRFPQAGDRFYPLGAPGHKKLKDFFIDAKIPRAERPYIPLVVSGEEIAWVVGYRIAEPFKVGSETQQILRLRCGIMQVNNP